MLYPNISPSIHRRLSIFSLVIGLTCMNEESLFSFDYFGISSYKQSCNRFITHDSLSYQFKETVNHVVVQVLIKSALPVLLHKLSLVSGQLHNYYDYNFGVFFVQTSCIL